MKEETSRSVGRMTCWFPPTISSDQIFIGDSPECVETVSIKAEDRRDCERDGERYTTFTTHVSSCGPVSTFGAMLGCVDETESGSASARDTAIGRPPMTIPVRDMG